MPLFRRDPAAPPRQTFRLRKPEALTASAISVGVQDGRDAALKSQAPVGQTTSKVAEALGFYARLGECWYPAQFYARAMKRIRYYPALLNDAGEPEEVEDGPLRDLFDRIHDPGGTTMMQLALNYGRLSFLIGDGYLIVSEQEINGDKEEVWEYLSPLELTLTRDTNPQEYERNTGLKKTKLVEAGDLEAVGGNKVRVWRLWRKNPGQSGLSDAPVLAQLENYATLERMTLAVGATSWNRAALRDLLYIPDEVSLIGGTDPNDPGVDEDMMEDSFMRELTEMLTAPISDPGSVESIMPPVLRGPAVFETPSGQQIPYAQLIAKIQVGRDNPYFEADAWPKVIERIALGLDMPNEMVTGTGTVNHWGGWLLDEQGFRQHVAGVVEDFCEDIGSAYLRPAAKADGSDIDWENVVVWYDPVAAIAHPDEGPTAMEAWKVGAVSREYVRESIGAEDGDAPDEEDETFLLELLGRRPSADTTDDGETAPQDGGTGGDTTEAPPVEPVNGNGNGAAVTAAAMRAAMILGAAEMQIRQARKAAGARLVQRSKNCGECQDAIRDVPLGLVASTLGAASVREIINGHTTEDALVCGVGDLLAEQVREFGVAGPWPDQLGAMVESHALRTLYEGGSPRLPPGFAATVEKALR